jgi:hypothetical protein
MDHFASDSRYFPDMAPAPDRRRSARRQEIRMEVKPTPATLCVAARLPIEVEIKDVSRSGLGMITQSPVPVGSSVVVVRGALTINGAVRHCRERLDGEYFVGICITRIVDTATGTEM